jgi:hypothetical protein
MKKRRSRGERNRVLGVRAAVCKQSHSPALTAGLPRRVIGLWPPWTPARRLDRDTGRAVSGRTQRFRRPLYCRYRHAV